jgi:chromosome segregation ATPase
MYGETAAMRKRAAQLREQGTDVRTMADRLVAQLETLDWQGRAAADMRSRIHDRAAHLRDCASQHENAAESLERHLSEVDRLKDSIASTERKASSLVTDARTRIAQLSRQDDPTGVIREPTDSDRLLDQFVPPQPGHKDWLTVTLPGL